MFNCTVCNKSIGPKVKPIHVVTGRRPVEYHNEYFVEDEWGNKEKREVDSRGTEITGEVLVCAACAGEEVPALPARFRIGSHSFREKDAEPLRPLFIAHVVQNMLKRLDHDSKRAKRDTEVAIPNIKRFVDTNPKLIF